MSESREFNLLSFFLRVDRAFNTILTEYSDDQRAEVLAKSVCEIKVDDSNIDDLHDLVKLLVRAACSENKGDIKEVMVKYNESFNQLLEFMACFSYLKDHGWVYEIEREFAACGYMLYGITPQDLINIDFGEEAA